MCVSPSLSHYTSYTNYIFILTIGTQPFIIIILLYVMQKYIIYTKSAQNHDAMFEHLYTDTPN